MELENGGTELTTSGAGAKVPENPIMEIDSIVIVSLHSPKEKIWGRLHSLTPAGVTIQGIDLNAFDDWVRQIRTPSH